MLLLMQVGTWFDAAFSTPEWKDYAWVGTNSAPFALTAGDHILTVCIDYGDANIDKFV
jgi:hypothetical protein